MRRNITIFLSFLLISSMLTPPLVSLFTDVELVCLDFSEDEEKKESKGEKELKDLILQHVADSSLYEDMTIANLNMHGLGSKYTAYFDVHIPPPEHIS